MNVTAIATEYDSAFFENNQKAKQAVYKSCRLAQNCHMFVKSSNCGGWTSRSSARAISRFGSDSDV